MFDFDAVQNNLSKLGSLVDASEAHGTMIGLLLGRQEFSKWLQYTLEDLPDVNNLLAKEQLQHLNNLFDEAKTQINADDMGLELLLPDDDQEFAHRLIGLASWCQGFLYGVAIGGGEAMIKVLPDQAKECMDDILNISQLAHDEEQTDEAELVFTELAEHVRMSVIYLNEEINPVTASNQIH